VLAPGAIFCHDPQGAKVPYPAVLDSIKKYLEAGIPSMFGFWGFQNHFPDIRKMVGIGSKTERPVDDIALTRYTSF
jgi:hypothetical protein